MSLLCEQDPEVIMSHWASEEMQKWVSLLAYATIKKNVCSCLRCSFGVNKFTFNLRSYIICRPVCELSKNERSLSFFSLVCFSKNKMCMMSQMITSLISIAFLPVFVPITRCRRYSEAWVLARSCKQGTKCSIKFVLLGVKIKDLKTVK